MRVAFLLPLRHSASEGLAKYVRQVVPRWRQNAGEFNVDVVVPKGILPCLDSIGASVVEVPRNDFRSGFRAMSGVVNGGNYDIALSAIARPLDIKNTPLVVTVQNVEPIQDPTYPMPLLWRMRLLALRREHRHACTAATHIISVSAYVKEQLCRRFEIPSERVDVVYHGYDSAEATRVKRPRIRDLGAFIFCAGSIVPYRGYEDVIRMLGVLKRWGNSRVVVVFAGDACRASRGYERSLQLLANKTGVVDSVIWAGHLDPAEMNWCFQNGKMFIQTSRAEAFPNILVEACGNGAVVISCDHQPMPEVLAESAQYYSPGAIDALAAMVVRTLDKTNTPEDEVRKRAKKRASMFSWDSTAEKTVRVLERIWRCSQ